jgi:two-component system sensor histidine kinase GlrK
LHKRYPKSFLRLILSGFLLVALPLVVAIGYAVFTLQGLAARSEQAVQRASAAARASRQFVESLFGMERALRQYVVVRNEALVEDYRRLRADLRHVSGELAFAALEEQNAKRLASVLERERQLLARLEATVGFEHVPEELVDEFQNLAGESLPVVEAARAVADTEVARLEHEASRARDALLLPLVAALALAVGTAWWFRNIISAQIAQIDTAIRAIGRGDYDRPIVVSGPDDLAFLGRRLEWLRHRLADLEEQKGRFLRHVSHDLKTPLTAIREGAQLLADGVPGPLADKQRTIVGIMSQNSLRLQKLIEELLNFQQASVAANTLDLQPVALEALVDKVLLTHRLAAQARNIRVQKILPPVQVEGDPEKLRVVVDNLVTNAIKFSPQRGVVRVLLQSGDGQAVLDVVDEGPGVTEAEREKIFDAFFRGKRAAERAEGSGLGLAIAREYVTAHLGRIELVPSPEGGARFRVTLPKVRQEQMP